MPLVVRISPLVEGCAQTVGAATGLAEDLARAGLPARPAGVVPPPGAKADVGAVGSLVVDGLLSASAVAAFARVIIAFLTRDAARSIIIERGDERLEINGISAPEQRQVIEDWCATRGQPPADTKPPE
jgi:hypothetical protein